MTSGFADWTRVMFGTSSSIEQKKLYVTDTETSTSFSAIVKWIMIYNSGPCETHINFDDTATTEHFLLPAGAFIFLGLKLISVHAVCPSGKSTTLYIMGFR